MTTGYTQEQDGSRSMRRLLALYYSLLSGALLLIGALYGTTAGIYGGLGCGGTVSLSTLLETLRPGFVEKWRQYGFSGGNHGQSLEVIVD